MDKYAMYLRKSRADMEAEKLGEGETLTRHKKILTELAAKKGLYVEKIYQEIISGETIAARPEITQLIQDCYAGMYKGIIIIEVTRLSRGNQADMQTIMDMLKYANNRSGILVITPTKTYDVAHSPDDEEYMEFELFMSRREYKMIRKRMQRGKIQAVIEGNYMGSYRPYGYDVLKTRTGRTLTPNKDEAPIVQKIFQWAANNNMTAGEIARKLTTMGVPTYTGAPEWNLGTIKTILTNPTYIGKVRWNDRMMMKTLVDGKMATSRPRSNHGDQYMECDGKHEAIIDEATFNALKNRFHSDKTKADCKLLNPLAGLLECAVCHYAMPYHVYRDRNALPRFAHRQSQTCKVKSVHASDVMDALVCCLKRYIADFEMKIDNLPSEDENTIQDEMNALEKELLKTERKLPKLFDAWENGIITDNEFAERKALNNEKIESLKKQIADLEDSIPEKEDYEEMIINFHAALNALLDDSLDADIKNEYLKSIIDRIEFSRENNSEFILDVYIKSDGAMV